VLQFVVGVVLLHEEMPTSRWIGFAIVWVALIVLTTDMVVTSRRSRARGREADRAAALAPDPDGGRDAGPGGDRSAGAESMSRIANETAG
jgi:chloramphenicol-sensitive protein RarD